jgi:hypothetical protein
MAFMVPFKMESPPISNHPINCFSQLYSLQIKPGFLAAAHNGITDAVAKAQQAATTLRISNETAVKSAAERIKDQEEGTD